MPDEPLRGAGSLAVEGLRAGAAGGPNGLPLLFTAGIRCEDWKFLPGAGSLIVPCWGVGGRNDPACPLPGVVGRGSFEPEPGETGLEAAPGADLPPAGAPGASERVGAGGGSSEAFLRAQRVQ
jgi:hypothetical protein